MAPMLCKYSPSAQVPQASAPGATESYLSSNVPTEQVLHAVEPVPRALNKGDTNAPCGKTHCEHAKAPGSEYFPAPHSVQEFKALQYLPAAQSRQETAEL
jgi:hypothetical protein